MFIIIHQLKQYFLSNVQSPPSLENKSKVHPPLLTFLQMLVQFHGHAREEGRDGTP